MVVESNIGRGRSGRLSVVACRPLAGGVWPWSRASCGDGGRDTIIGSLVGSSVVSELRARVRVLRCRPHGDDGLLVAGPFLAAGDGPFSSLPRFLRRLGPWPSSERADWVHGRIGVGEGAGYGRRGISSWLFSSCPAGIRSLFRGACDRFGVPISALDDVSGLVDVFYISYLMWLIPCRHCQTESDSPQKNVSGGS